MNNSIEIKETSFDEIVQVSSLIPEFDEDYITKSFKERWTWKETLILSAYADWPPVGYLVWYDRYQDSSFYCWMTGVAPRFRQQGILTALMNYQDQWAKDHGYIMVKIKTRNTRREMLAYLVKQGFNFIEVISQDSVEENRILLQKNI